MRVLFVGGGTLGSVTPLLAVAEELGREFEISNLKFEIRFWGTRTGPEHGLVEVAGIPFRSIPAGKLRRYWDIRNLFDLMVVKWAFWVAFVRLIRWRPNVVMGAGSFVQVPVMWAAWVLRIPIIIHQLDVRPSLANHLVAPFATRITVTFPESAKAFRHAEVVGAPVRRAILAARDMDPREAKRRFGFDDDHPVLLILGGGTGAQAMNFLVQRSLPALTAAASVIHVTGRGKSIDVSGHPEMIREIIRTQYQQFELLTNAMPAAYAAADLVISRAGIGTISELVALRKPTFLIPISGTHQEDNAAAMEDRGAMVVWHGRYLTPAEVSERILALLNVAQRKTLARYCAQAFSIDAAGRIAEMIRAISSPSA